MVVILEDKHKSIESSGISPPPEKTRARQPKFAHRLIDTLSTVGKSRIRAGVVETNFRQPFGVLVV